MIKYGTTKTNFAKNTRRIKRTTRRVPRSIKSSGVSMRVEYNDIVYCTPGSPVTVLFGTIGINMLNYSTVLTQNPGFVSQATNFMRYKIGSATASFTPCFTETSVNTAFLQGIPIIFAQQYPILTSAVVADEVIYSDNNLMVKPMSLTQSKTWSYKNNYLVGIGNGVGVWNQTNNVAQQQGQISIKAPNNFVQNSSGSNVTLYFVRIALWVQLDGKSR